MTPTQKVALWERVNAYAEVCGGDTSEGAVGADRQRAVVALESEIECFERKAVAMLVSIIEALTEMPAPATADCVKDSEDAGSCSEPIGEARTKC